MLQTTQQAYLKHLLSTRQRVHNFLRRFFVEKCCKFFMQLPNGPNCERMRFQIVRCICAVVKTNIGQSINRFYLVNDSTTAAALCATSKNCTGLCRNSLRLSGVCIFVPSHARFRKTGDTRITYSAISEFQRGINTRAIFPHASHRAGNFRSRDFPDENQRAIRCVV